jgi:ribosomal protein L6P/L9E
VECKEVLEDKEYKVQLVHLEIKVHLGYKVSWEAEVVKGLRVALVFKDG